MPTSHNLEAQAFYTLWALPVVNQQREGLMLNQVYSSHEKFDRKNECETFVEQKVYTTDSEWWCLLHVGSRIS